MCIVVIIIAFRGIFYNLLTAPRTVSNMYIQVARAQSCANHVQHIECLSHATCHVTCTLTSEVFHSAVILMTLSISVQYALKQRLYICICTLVWEHHNESALSENTILNQLTGNTVFNEITLRINTTLNQLTLRINTTLNQLSLKVNTTLNQLTLRINTTLNQLTLRINTIPNQLTLRINTTLNQLTLRINSTRNQLSLRINTTLK